MYLKYADNFSFTLAASKSLGGTYFTVAWTTETDQTFVNAFGNNPLLQGSKSAFYVPITLLDGSDNVVASGYATHWDWEDTGNEAKVYTTINEAASIGYKLSCRHRAAVATSSSLHTSIVDEWTIDTAAMSAPMNKEVVVNTAHALIQVDVSGGKIILGPGGSEHINPELPAYWVSDMTPQLPRYTISMKDGVGTQPTFTFHIDSHSAYDTIVWEGGSAPTFDVSNNCILVEVMLGCRSTAKWFGRWTRFNAT